MIVADCWPQRVEGCAGRAAHQDELGAHAVGRVFGNGEDVGDGDGGMFFDLFWCGALMGGGMG